ncbi:MAG: glycogen-binding domain-containing protein [Treponema sp.]|jgi:hypothetical protein|nr:glycogen-binding domain-containing protein [Treponema sp.]
MKTFAVFLLHVVLIGGIGALDTESYQFIDHLLKLKKPGPPELFEDGVLFTASSAFRRVGIAFAHESFSKIYWFRDLLVIRDDITPEEWAAKTPPQLYQDSGILFHAYTVPPGMQELEYRLIIDGLWTTDPLNPSRRIDERSGVLRSVVSVGGGGKTAFSEAAPSEGALHLTYHAPPGETVTVAGSFNDWDPFMYELRETSPGNYSLTLPLPPGTYRYLFYYRGEKFTDPNNSRRAYTQGGTVVSEAVVN